MNEFGGSGITLSLFSWITGYLPAGSHILELGSGDVSTKMLGRMYKITSVEDKPEFVNRYPNQYIYAPLTDGWYDPVILQARLRRLPRYALILVDGPAGSEARTGFLKHIELFDLKATIVIDDTWRAAEKQMALDISAAHGHALIADIEWCALIP